MPYHRSLAIALALASSFATAVSWASDTHPTARPSTGATVQLQHIRNATTKITYADTTFLIDPMLADKGRYPGFENTYRSHLRNPLVDLPAAARDIIADVDAVIVTHTHLDHWDDAAQELLPKTLPLFVQNAADAQTIRAQGFTDVRILDDQAEFGGVTLSKTGGQHGTDRMFANPEVAGFLGEAMGVVFQARDHKSLYLAGDTIWRPEVDQTLAKYKPQVIVLNAGYAQLSGYDGAIIMGKEDVAKAAQAAPDATIVAVHLDAINHMALSREALARHVEEKGISDRVQILEDGEALEF